MHKLRAVAAALLATVAVSGAAPAPSIPTPEGHWTTAHVYVHNNGVAGVARAVADWNALSELRVTMQDTPCTPLELACVEVAYGPLPKYEAGAAIISAPHGVIASCRVVVNSTPAYPLPADLAQLTDAHEVGHCLGLGHEPAAADSAMEDGVQDRLGGWHVHPDPTDLDRDALQAIYG